MNTAFFFLHVHGLNVNQFPQSRNCHALKKSHHPIYSSFHLIAVNIIALRIKISTDAILTVPFCYCDL